MFNKTVILVNLQYDMKYEIICIVFVRFVHYETKHSNKTTLHSVINLYVAVFWTDILIAGKIFSRIELVVFN